MSGRFAWEARMAGSQRCGSVVAAAVFGFLGACSSGGQNGTVPEQPDGNGGDATLGESDARADGSMSGGDGGRDANDGVADSGVADSRVADSGVADSGVADSGVTDSGDTDGGGSTDASTADAGADAAPDAAMADDSATDAGDGAPMTDADTEAGGDAESDGGATDALPDALVDAACPPSMEHCPTGCASLGSDPNNCNACGIVCPAGPHATAACTAGACAIVCDPGYLDCDGNPANGCEIDGTTTPSHCGTCDNNCAPANATPGCMNGVCAIATCSSGFADCNMMEPDGCECDTPGCCGSACMFKHSNGVGQNYFDCSPLGTPLNASTYDVTMATEAAGAFCPGTSVGRVCGGSDCIELNGCGMCGRWCYSGPLAGRVRLGGSCACPTGASSTWD
jgi:hypothetical protein